MQLTIDSMGTFLAENLAISKNFKFSIPPESTQPLIKKVQSVLLLNGGCSCLSKLVDLCLMQR